MRRDLLCTTFLHATPDGRGSSPAPGAGPDVILSEAQTAQASGLSQRTLQRLRLDGGGPPFVRLTVGRVGYSRRALEAWIAGRTFASTSAETAGRRVAGVAS